MEPTSINGRMTSGYQLSITLVKPYLKEVLCFFLEIVGLQIVNNCNVIYVLAILGDELVPRVFVLILKLTN